MGKVLGKGLSALINNQGADIEPSLVAHIRVESVRDNKLQPRTDYNDERLQELMASIKENGVLQPILVRPVLGGYEVVAGERRLKAARALQLTELPAIVKDVSDQEALVIALIENIQREALNPIEEAQAYKRLMNDFSYTQEDVASSVGKDRSTVGNLLRLLNLPENIQKAVFEGSVTVGHARTLLSVESTGEKDRLLQLIKENSLSVRELENIIKGGQTKSGLKGSRREKNADASNPQIVALEDGLQKLLGTKIRINANKKRGKIVIDYYSMNDLDRIIKLIIKNSAQQ